MDQDFVRKSKASWYAAQNALQQLFAEVVPVLVNQGLMSQADAKLFSCSGKHQAMECSTAIIITATCLRSLFYFERIFKNCPLIITSVYIRWQIDVNNNEA